MRGQFYDTDGGFGKATTEELNRCSLEDAGRWCGLVVFAVPGPIPARKDGWAAKWVRQGRDQSDKMLVLVGTTAFTRALRREGVLRKWMREGLSREQAERLYALPEAYRHELVGKLVAVLSDQWLTRAFLAHPGGYGSGSGRTAWCQAWAEAREEVGHLSAPREAALAQMVRACTACAHAA